MGALRRQAPEASGIRSLSLPFLTPVVPARSRRFQVPWCGRSAAGDRPLPPTASLLPRPALAGRGPGGGAAPRTEYAERPPHPDRIYEAIRPLPAGGER